MITFVDRAFPKLDAEELELLFPLSTCEEYEDGAAVFKAGDTSIDLLVVESGLLKIINPADNDDLIVTYEAGQFAGDINLLTHRPYLVTGIAAGNTRILRVPGHKLCEVLLRIPRLSEKLILAFEARRELYTQTNKLGFKVVGPGHCQHTTIIREFLHRNFVPFTWHDPESLEGKKTLDAAGSINMPLVQCPGQFLVQPTVQELSSAAQIWQHVPAQAVDFVVIGAGPAGITSAVYAASEGLSTLILDSFAPGGQAGGSSRIENFIGFPAGLSGNDLALRGVMQILKFGGHLYAPVGIQEIEPAAKLGDYHKILLDCGSTIQAKSVLIATGMRWRKLEAENAAHFERAGIYYVCTTVEAVLHDHTDVGVVGGGNSAGQAATFLAECCRDRTVHLFVRRKLESNMSTYLVERIRSMPNISLHEETTLSKIYGQGTTIEAADIEHKGEKSRLPLSAVFVFIGADPSTQLLPDYIGRDEKGFVLVGPDAGRSGKWPLADREPYPLETTIPGILAAGDVRSGSEKRVGFAVGDGSQSVACVHKLLAAIARRATSPGKL